MVCVRSLVLTTVASNTTEVRRGQMDPNSDEANLLLAKKRRKGWELPVLT